ncbi:inovirus Gp2 family protein [Citrobacter freundii]
MQNYIPSYANRIQQTITTAINCHPRLACFFVTLRFPQDIKSRDGKRTISRFFDALKYQINEYVDYKRLSGKRAHPTTLYYLWAREFGFKNGNKHYHVVLMLNKDTFHTLGDYNFSISTPDSLSNLIQKAWCSALDLPPEAYHNLASAPDKRPCMWIENNDPFQKAAAEQRMLYLAKEYSKQNGDGERSFGCSQNNPSLLNGRKTRE